MIVRTDFIYLFFKFNMTSELMPIIQNAFGVPEDYSTFKLKIATEDNEIYKLRPGGFIKMTSKYIDQFIADYHYGKVIKNLRYRYKITVKFNLSKYQTSRILLEIIYNQQFTKELDLLFEQLKLYGNFIIKVNSGFDEIINYIYECNIKSNKLIQDQIDIINDKMTKFNTLTNPEIVKNFNDRIRNYKSKMRIAEIKEIKQYIIETFTAYLRNIPMPKQEIIKHKVCNYIEQTFINPELLKSLANYENNSGDALGKKFENHVLDTIKPILNQNGFEIISNTEFVFDYETSGIKLEYDYMIGKIKDNKFIIYGVFDAKISKGLINQDIDKFGQSIKRLLDNKMEMRKDSKRVNYGNFDMIEVFNEDAIMMGYFCMSNFNCEKEASKYISSYLINHSKSTYELIEGSNVIFTTGLIDKIEAAMNVEYLNLVTILTKYNSHIFTIEME